MENKHMPETRLTPEAQKEIQRFMWKAVAIPAIPASIILFLGGFFINDVFKVKAENTAFSQAYSNLQELTEETTKARFESETAKKAAEKAALDAHRILEQANKIKDEARKIQIEANDIQKRLQRAESFQKSEELVQEVKDFLREDTGFIADTVEHTNEKIQEHAKKLSMIKKQVSDIEAKQRKSPIQFLQSNDYRELWRGKTGGPYTENFSDVVPKSANGVILRVIVNTTKSSKASGSFVCGDSNGHFNTELWHYDQIGVTNYSNTWIGGMVLCPLNGDRTMTWQMMSNDNKKESSSKVTSIAAVVGWF